MAGSEHGGLPLPDHPPSAPAFLQADGSALFDFPIPSCGMPLAGLQQVADLCPGATPDSGCEPRPGDALSIWDRLNRLPGQSAGQTGKIARMRPFAPITQYLSTNCPRFRMKKS
jgi:hypothetical protein